MISELVVGQRNVADGTAIEQRGSKDASTIVQDSHGRYIEAVYRGNVYFAANQAAVTFSAGLTTTTAVGLVLSNPPASQKLLVPLQVEYINSGAVVGLVGLCVQPYSATAITHTTALTIRNAYVSGGNTSVANADQGATLALAAVVWKAFYSLVSTNTGLGPSPAIIDLGGSLILPPGTACAILASAATTGIGSITWEEINP